MAPGVVETKEMFINTRKSLNGFGAKDLFDYSVW